MSASLFCVPDSSTAPAFTAGPVPLSGDGDARIDQNVTVCPVSRAGRARAPERGFCSASQDERLSRGEADEPVLDEDELVARQGFDRFGVELREWARALRDEP